MHFFTKMSLILEENKEVLNPDYAHWFIYVFDMSETMTEQILRSYFEAFQAAEASENQNVLASDSNKFRAEYQFWGNKCDMEWAEFAKVKGNLFQMIFRSWMGESFSFIKQRYPSKIQEACV